MGTREGTSKRGRPGVREAVLGPSWLLQQAGKGLMIGEGRGLVVCELDLRVPLGGGVN